ELCLLGPGLLASLAWEATFSPRLLVTAVNRQGVLFVWPIRLPGPDGKIDDWSKSALDASVIGQKEWVRVSANMSLGAYDVAVASAQMTEPSWPDRPFGELLRIAFRGKMI